MSAATATFTLNSFPNGRDLHNNHLALLGTIAVSAGTYPANGIALSFAGAAVYTGIAPFDGTVYSPTTGIPYQFDPLNQTLRIFTSRAPAPGVTTAAFTPSANFGTSPVLALSANSTQSAFSIDVTAEVTTGANPTLTYVFPQPYSVAPVVVISRGTDADLTAGYWTTIDASTTATQCVFTFVGTPTATKDYVLDAIIADVGTNASAVVAAGNFAISSGWGTAAALTLSNASSTQKAFSAIVTAGSAATTANPTVTLTFPVPYATAPQFTVSDGVIRPTTGHWVFLSSTTTTATFAWIGTPTATNAYKFDAVAVTPVLPAITTAAFALRSGLGSTSTKTVIGNEGAFQLTIAVSGSGIGANPTVTVTLPAALAGTPIAVVSPGR